MNDPADHWDKDGLELSDDIFSATGRIVPFYADSTFVEDAVARAEQSFDDAVSGIDGSDENGTKEAAKNDQKKKPGKSPEKKVGKPSIKDQGTEKKSDAEQPSSTAENAPDQAIIASFWRAVPGKKPWDFRHDPSAGGDDPPHTHYRKGSKEYGRRVYKNQTQAPHGKGVDKDVPEDVIKATPPNKFPGPEAPQPQAPEKKRAGKNALERFFGDWFLGPMLQTGGSMIAPVPPKRMVIVGGGTLILGAPEIGIPVVAGAAAVASP